MNFLNKIKNLNQYISFHILAIGGWAIVFSHIYYLIGYNKASKLYSNGCYGDAFAWFYLGIFGLCMVFPFIAFIIFSFEQVFKFKIKNNVLLNNTFLKTLRYSGTLLAIIYLIFILVMILTTIFSLKS